MGEKPAEPVPVVASLAARQFGIVTTTQLTALGLSKDWIYGKVHAGWLHRRYRGVFAAGNPSPSIEGRYMAAVLACGVGAVLSHGSAATHWGMIRQREGGIHVTIPDRGSRAQRNGIQLHRSSAQGHQQITRHRGIPITSPRRTLADLLRTERPEVVRRAARQASVLGLNIGEEGERDRTRSELERRMLWLFRRHRLPRPEVNVRVGGLVVDFLLRESRVVIETDGWRYHRGREALKMTALAMPVFASSGLTFFAFRIARSSRIRTRWLGR